MCLGCCRRNPIFTRRCLARPFFSQASQLPLANAADFGRERARVVETILQARTFRQKNIATTVTRAKYAQLAWENVRTMVALTSFYIGASVSNKSTTYLNYGVCLQGDMSY